jgi:hypothetical protein
MRRSIEKIDVERRASRKVALMFPSQIYYSVMLLMYLQIHSPIRDAANSSGIRFIVNT